MMDCLYLKGFPFLKNLDPAQNWIHDNRSKVRFLVTLSAALVCFVFLINLCIVYNSHQINELVNIESAYLFSYTNNGKIEVYPFVVVIELRFVVSVSYVYVFPLSNTVNGHCTNRN